MHINQTKPAEESMSFKPQQSNKYNLIHTKDIDIAAKF